MNRNGDKVFLLFLHQNSNLLIYKPSLQASSKPRMKACWGNLYIGENGMGRVAIYLRTHSPSQIGNQSNHIHNKSKIIS